MSARYARAQSGRQTAAIASPAQRSSSPMASMTSPTTSFISCSRGCRMRRRARKAFRSFWSRSFLSTTTARSARAICEATGAAIDRAHRGKDDAARKAGDQRASLLTPVAKAFSTDIGSEVASLGVQVHGGMGFIEETGAAQHYRDARIAQIYEGTNGIQAIDLVTRKIPMMGGAVMHGYLDELRRTVASVKATNDPAFGAAGARLGEAVESLDRATTWLIGKLDKSPDAALAGAAPYLRLFAFAAGGCMLAENALAESRGGIDGGGRVALARFFAENISVQAGGLETTITEGAESVSDAALRGAA